MTKGERIATIVFRIIVGAIGLIVLTISIRFEIYAKDWRSFTVVGAFCGLLLGYAFGGDKWGARLFNFFTGHRVPTYDEPLKTGRGNTAQRNVDVINSLKRP